MVAMGSSIAHFHWENVIGSRYKLPATQITKQN